jgi:hypothetical protein
MSTVLLRHLMTGRMRGRVVLHVPGRVRGRIVLHVLARRRALLTVPRSLSVRVLRASAWAVPSMRRLFAAGGMRTVTSGIRHSRRVAG